MEKYLYLVLLILFSNKIYCQNYFSIQTDFFDGFSDGTQELVLTQEGIIALNSHLCLDDFGNPINDCASYVLYDYEGNVMVKKLLPFIDIQYHSLQYDEINQEVIIVGHNPPNSVKNNIFQLYKCSLEGDSLFHQSYEITEADGRLAFLNGVQIFSNNYVLIGQAKYGDDTFEDSRATNMWINQNGMLDTIITFDTYQYNSHQGVVDKDGNLTVMYASFDPNNFFWKKKVGFKKFNEDKEIVWEWESPFNFDDNRLPIFDITENNEIVFLFQPDVELFDDESAVGMLSETGEMLWQHEFVSGPYKRYSIFELVVADNGDILGVGTMRDITEETSDGILYDTGFAFRLSASGELLWMRRFRDFNNQGLFKWGALHGIAEAEDGSLVMGGQQYHNIWDVNAQIDAWLIITDENGCIEPDCEDLIILDNRELFFTEEEIQLIQNPVADRMRLNLTLTNYEPLDYQIFDALGRSILQGRINQPSGISETDVANLPDGILYLYVYSQEKRRTFKIIKK